MRVILVGPAADRDRLRARLNGSMVVVAEFPTLGAARVAEIGADAILLAAEPDEHEASIVEPLTSREIQVLELLAEGLPNKAIAARLGISDQTVKFHVASISGKLGAANRTDAVRRAVRRGLISL
jgi:DNA-binding NarL/FixJ family response regulator